MKTTQHKSIAALVGATFAAAALSVIATQAAKAERAGVAAAVNTETTGKPPGGTLRQIVLGQNVLHNEVIRTDATGQAQILMLDRTALTIGPNTTLVIDRFIYDPAAGAGDMSLTLRRGLLRFTGGALSKNQPVNVRTPVATVGIRGGMGLIEVPSDDSAAAAFLFGNEMTVSIGGALATRMARAGFGTDITSDGASPPVRWDTSRILTLMEQLQGGDGRPGGLSQPLDRGQIDQGLQDALPRQDAQALNQAINQILSNTEILQKGPVGAFYNTLEQTRPFNDLKRDTGGPGNGEPPPPPVDVPKEPPPPPVEVPNEPPREVPRDF
jgi:hypothetical protein